MPLLGSFFDKGRGAQVALTEFPFLFAMLNYAGGCGVILTFGWFAILVPNYPQYLNRATSIAGVAVFAGFIAITVLSTIYGQAVVDSRFDQRRTPAGWDFFARSRMSILLILFAFTCSTLIWMTGGMFSPFNPFYIMVFTLALTRCKLPHPGTALLLLFVAPFAAAGLLGRFGPNFFNDGVFEEIRKGGAKDLIDYGFALVSMVVPYGSTYLAEARASRQKRAAAEHHENQSVGADEKPGDAA